MMNTFGNVAGGAEAGVAAQDVRAGLVNEATLQGDDVQPHLHHDVLRFKLIYN